MNKLKSLSCCLILWLPLAQAVDFDAALTTRGRWAFDIDDGDSQSLELTLLPELDADFDNGWRFHSRARLRADAIDGMQIDALNRDAYSDYSKPGFLTEAVALELRELYLQGEIGDIFVRLGKQQIVWGKSDGLKVLDIVNPQSFREFILADYEHSRIPLWTLTVEQTVVDWDLQFVWIPDQTYHALPEQDGRYALTSKELIPVAPAGVRVNIDRPDRPGNVILDSDVGIRLSRFWQGWDITFNYLYQYNNLPVLKQNIGLVDDRPRVTISPEYRRTHVFGATFSNAFDNWVLRGEIGYFTEHYFIGNNPRRNRGVVQSPELHYVLGLDWDAPWDLLVSLQLIQSWVLEDAEKTTRDRLDSTLTGLIRRNFLYDTLIAEVLVIANSNNGDGLIRPKMSYQWNDEVKTWLGADFFYGDNDGVFGQFDDNDRVLFGLEWSF